MTDIIDEPIETATAQQKPELEIMATRQMTSWMYDQRISLAFTTYQSGKIFFIGLQEDGKLSVFQRNFNRAMGVCVSPDAETIFLSDLCLCWRMQNALPKGQTHNGYDKLYVPQIGYTTGDIDIHDMAIDKNGNPIFVTTLFSCIATVSETHSFKPLWKPFFISKLAAEDRCHLNGLAMEEGVPKYVTAVSQSDAHEAWREKRRDGGIVIDVEKNQVVVEGLSMPHSPRMYQGKLWLINSGTGYFGYVDFKDEAKTKGEFVPTTFCSGYARGLTFVGDFALVGVSKQRENRTFSGLALDEEIAKRQVTPKCGIFVINLKTGDVVHSLQIDGSVDEVYDVIALPNTLKPMALGFRTNEIRHMLSIEMPETK